MDSKTKRCIARISRIGKAYYLDSKQRTAVSFFFTASHYFDCSHDIMTANQLEPRFYNIAAHTSL